MNSKMTTNSQQLTNEPKRKEQQQKEKLSKQLEQEQNHRNIDHIFHLCWRRIGEKVQGIRSITGRCKPDRRG